MTDHARLSPSSAHRWINCPGSANFEATVGDEFDEHRDTSHRDEGTAAHTLAALCLEAWFDLNDPMMPHDRIGESIEGIVVNQEMADGVKGYVDYCKEVVECEDSYTDVEWQVNLSVIYPGTFGTCDFSTYDPYSHVLEIVDFKYGKGVVVEVEENPQLMLYAAGVLARLHNVGRPERVRMTVVQPRAYHRDGPIRTWQISIDEFQARVESIKEAAQLASQPDAPLNPGPWCRWCKALPMCDAARRHSVEKFKRYSEVENLTTDEIGDVLREAETIKTWIKGVEDYAIERANRGQIPTGYKLVAKQSRRKVIDENAVIDQLRKFRVPQKQYLEAKLKSPAQLEKILKPKHMQKLEESYIKKESSGNKLVPMSSDEIARVPAVRKFGAVECT